MKKTFNVLFNLALCAVFPGVAAAAGTYYNNSVYQRYGSNGADYNASSRSYASRYGQQQTTVSNTQTTTRTVTRAGGVKKVATPTAKKQGFVGGVGLSHEFASWNFDMKTAGSKLHYDNVAWNVLDGNVAYYFGESMPMQIKVGARYGMQFGESPMIDDDISNGGYLVTTWTDADNNIIGYQTGHALSVGTSKSGNQIGFNAAFGLTDFFKWGRVKVTPSVGYRYLRYKLKTERNYGTAVEIFESTDAHPYITCISGYMGEIQCDPFLLFYGTNASGVASYTITGRVIDEDTGLISDLIQMPLPGVLSTISGIGTGGTYYYEQSGTSHEYTTTWAGPYLAMDMEYDIDSKNAVTGGVELGLPYYTSEGNQPYRYDWAHPKSVEDTGKLGDAVHLGVNAMWKTSIADATMLTLGFTYDYYKVSDATAKTFLNSGYYTELYNDYQNKLANPPAAGWTDAQIDAMQSEIATINSYRNAGWTLESAGEISSVYKSMGLRLGLEMKF